MRKKLERAEIEIVQQRVDGERALAKKVQRLRKKGMSYQKIADLFNLWRIETRTREGMWHAKTVRELAV